MSCAEEYRAEREKERRREEAYRVYVTDALYALCGFVGIRLKGRYCELVRSEGNGDKGKMTGSSGIARSEGTGDKERTTGSMGSTGSSGVDGTGAALERLEKMEIEVVR